MENLKQRVKNVINFQKGCFYLFIVLFILLSIPGLSQQKMSLTGYRKGDSAFIHFLAKNISYPISALENDIEGIYFTTLYIDSTSTLDSIDICNGEKYISTAIRNALYKTRKKWLPGKNRIIEIPFIFSLKDNPSDSIHFIPGGLGRNLSLSVALNRNKIIIMLHPIVIQRLTVKKYKND